MTPDAPPGVPAADPDYIDPSSPVPMKDPGKMAALSLASRAVHADDGISSHRAVAPAVHVSTTFRYSDDPDNLRAWDNVDVSQRVPLSLPRAVR